jgi:hypothetical protein
MEVLSVWTMNALDACHALPRIGLPYAAVMGKQKKPGNASTPSGSADGPPGKKQRRKARKSSKKRS